MEKEEKKIKLSDKVEVISTGKGGFYKEGEKFKVHPELAKKLIKQGKAKAVTK